MVRQGFKQDARRHVTEALSAQRKERLEQERRLADLAVDILTAIAERDQAVRTSEQQAADAVRALLAERLSIAEIADLCGGPLFVHQRWPRALVLAVLATEEAGKAILSTASLLPDDDLAALKLTRHEDKLTAAALMAAGFTGELSDLRALFSQIDSGALHRRKLSAIYVDRRDGGVASPSSVTYDDAERAIRDARRVIELLSEVLGQVSPEAIDCALRLNEALTPALDKYVQEHGDATGLQVARDLVAWSQSLSDTESTRESSSIWINHTDESFHNGQ